jgi:hypothetical protein
MNLTNAFPSRIVTHADVIVWGDPEKTRVVLDFSLMPQCGNEYLHQLAPNLVDEYSDRWSISCMIITDILMDECDPAAFVRPGDSPYEIIVKPRRGQTVAGAAIVITKFLSDRFGMTPELKQLPR